MSQAHPPYRGCPTTRSEWVTDARITFLRMVGPSPPWPRALGKVCRGHPKIVEQSRGAILMEKQQSFGSAAWSRKGKVTRRERFLAEMDAVIPWRRLLKLIEPHYHPGKMGRQPHNLERMLRIYFMQQWFNLSDPQAEDAIYDSESMRRFARVELGDDKVPDESTSAGSL